jgi:hypothetical protein
MFEWAGFVRQAAKGNRLRLLAIAGILGLALTLLACGGDKETTPEPVETPVASSPTTAPATTSRPSSTPTATSSSAGTLPARLPDLSSYKYTFKIEGTAGLIAEISGSTLPSGVNPNTGTLVFDVKGSYVKPDRGEATIAYGGVTVTRVVIGRQQWTRTNGALSGPAQITSSGDDDYSFVSAFWDSSATEALKDFSCSSSRETVNGVSTRKCTADRATVERLNKEGKLFTTGVLDLKSFSAGSAELWVADGDKVIRFRANVAGKDSSNRDVAFKMEVNISDINARFTIDQPR